MSFDQLRDEMRRTVVTDLTQGLNESSPHKVRSAYGETQEILLSVFDTSNTSDELHSQLEITASHIQTKSRELMTSDHPQESQAGVNLQRVHHFIIGEIAKNRDHALSATSFFTQREPSVPLESPFHSSLSTPLANESDRSIVSYSNSPMMQEASSSQSLFFPISADIAEQLEQADPLSVPAQLAELNETCERINSLVSSLPTPISSEQRLQLENYQKILSAAAAKMVKLGKITHADIFRLPAKDPSQTLRRARNTALCSSHSNLLKCLFNLGKIVSPDNPVMSLAFPSQLAPQTTLSTAGNFAKTLSLITGGVDLSIARASSSTDLSFDEPELGKGIYCTTEDYNPYVSDDAGFVLHFRVIEELEGTSLPQRGTVASSNVAIDASSPTDLGEQKREAGQQADRAFSQVESDDSQAFLQAGSFPPGDTELVLYRPNQRIQLVGVDLHDPYSDTPTRISIDEFLSIDDDILEARLDQNRVSPQEIMRRSNRRTTEPRHPAQSRPSSMWAP